MNISNRISIKKKVFSLIKICIRLIKDLSQLFIIKSFLKFTAVFDIKNDTDLLVYKI